MTMTLDDAIAAIERSGVLHIDKCGDVLEAAIAADRELSDADVARLRVMRINFLRAVAVIENVCEGRSSPTEAQRD